MYQKTNKAKNHLRSCWRAVFLLLFWAGSLCGYAQERRVTLAGNNITIKEALLQVEQQTRMSVGYDESILDSQKRVAKKVENATLRSALDAILEGTACSYEINGNYIVIVAKNAKVKVNGTVRDANGVEVIGATIQAKGTDEGTITDMDGSFSLEVPVGTKLEISYIGYVTDQVTVTPSSQNLKIVLKEDAERLDEVVVIGYGTRSKRDVTTAISTMSSENIAKSVTLSPEMAMQGQMAGVQVQGNQGNPNSRPTIRIRGVNTWGVASPLYVIDGIPVKEYGAGVENDDYTRGNINIMSMIDPNDIESISILKDAASAAIYGVRAANGVILITTKSGRKETAPKIEYSHKIGVQNQLKRINVMNTQQYANYFNTFFHTNPSYPSDVDRRDLLVFDPSSPNYLGNSDTYDWQSASLNNNALTQDYSLRISGGTANADYNASFGYANEEGTRIGDDLERYSGAFRLNVDISKYIRTGVNIRLSHATGHSSIAPDLITAAAIPPWQPIYDENGLHGYAGVVEGYDEDGNWNSNVKYGSMTRNNFLGQMQTRDNVNSSTRIIGNAYLELKPLKGLSLKGTVSLDNFSNNIDEFSEYAGCIFEYGGVDPTAQPEGSVGSYAERKTTNTNLIYEFTANYTTSIQKNNLDVLFNLMGQQYNSKYTRGLTQYMTTTNPDLRLLGGENQYTSVSSSQNRGALVGMLLRLGYNYDYRYYVDVTMRRDGSSRFAPAHRWGYFPGVALAWRMSGESFMESAEWVDDIKFRASWGQLGNQEVNDMAYLSPINTAPVYAWGNNPNNPGYGYYSTGATIYGMANETLSWEKTTTFNAGVDFALFQGLNGSFEYYYKMTDGILQPVTLPPSVGLIDQPVDNIAAVKNTGFEVTLNYTKEFGDFLFSVGGNLTTVKNEVVKMYNGVPYLDRGIEEGYSMNYIRGYVLGGMFQSREEAEGFMDQYYDEIYKQAQVQGGDFWFKDVRGVPTEQDIANGDRFYSPNPDGRIDSYDQVYLGKTIPGFYYGLNLAAEYKGFDINAQFTGVGDVQKANVIKQSFLNTSAVAANQSPEIWNYWREDNKDTTIPRIRLGDPAGNNRFSSYFVENAGYFRMSNLQVGYTLPDAVYKALHNILNYARIYVGASNLFTLTNYGGLDPEDDYNPAPLICYTGLSLRF